MGETEVQDWCVFVLTIMVWLAHVMVHVVVDLGNWGVGGGGERTVTPTMRSLQ